MRSYNFNEVLKIVTEEIGISLETLSLCSGIPIESLNDPLFEIKQKDKARDLLLIMTLIINSDPVGSEDDYVVAHIKSLEDHFKISREVLAQYAEVSLSDFNDYLKEPNSISVTLKYQISTAILHLFSVLTRKSLI